MNAIKFALAATVMAFSMTATAQIVYIPDFPTKKAPAVEAATSEPVATESEKAA